MKDEDSTALVQILTLACIMTIVGLMVGVLLHYPR